MPNLPNLPDDLTEEIFEDTMAGLVTLLGNIDQAITDLPDNNTLVRVLRYYSGLAVATGMYDPHATHMVTTAAGSVMAMRAVIDSMYDDVITEITRVKDAT